jgi:hypothetical protein
MRERNDELSNTASHLFLKPYIVQTQYSTSTNNVQCILTMPNHHPYSNSLCFSTLFHLKPHTKLNRLEIPTHTICWSDSFHQTTTYQFLGPSSLSSPSLPPPPHIRRPNILPFLPPSQTTNSKHVVSTPIPTVRPRRRLLRLLHNPHRHVRLFTLWIFDFTPISYSVSISLQIVSFHSRVRPLSRPL